MSDLKQLSEQVAAQFEVSFGRTPLSERVNDLLNQAMALSRFRDVSHLQDETGDLLCSVLQLCTECRWEPADLVAATLRKIQDRQEVYRRLGRKLNVALLGGAFDPVHLGHVEVAREVLRVGAFDEVWLTPCFEHLYGKQLAPADHRVEMCRLATHTARSLGVFDYEVRHQLRGETYHLIKRLLGEEVARVRCDFSLIVGQDNADSFDSWSNASGLQRLIPFVVVPRAGSPAPRPSAWYLRPPHRYLDGVRLEHATSSTEVRELLRAGDPAVERLLPPEVLGYIRRHGLYAGTAVPAAPARKVALFASTFDPPGQYHRGVAEGLLQSGFDEVVICPTGPRDGREGPAHAAPIHRAVMVDLTFRDLAGLRVDLTDLDDGRFTPPDKLEERYAASGEVWHVIPSDFVVSGCRGQALVQTRWDMGRALWERSRFVIVHPPGHPPSPEDCPPTHRTFAVNGHVPCAELRHRTFEGEPLDGLVTPEVAAYVERYGLFSGLVRPRVTYLRIDRPRLLLVADERNPRAREMAEQYRPFVADPPNLILVLGGDGTMLHAIRLHWRRRLPFLGINAGHLGFLLNERPPPTLEGAELLAFSMPMLRVDTETPDGRVSQGLACGDTWVEREGGQAAWLQLDVDSQTRVPKVVGDGLLVATPSGSSSYARAMGATPVPLNTAVLTLAGSNIFRPRFWKPMALADEAVITITNLDRSGKRPVRCFLDGQPAGCVQRITARKSAVAAVELGFTKEHDPSVRLLRSLFPPQEDGV
jgi:nicotinate (nicotinamide) nucleotide adenylyltransferase